jgi:hypothetical protein
MNTRRIALTILVAGTQTATVLLVTGSHSGGAGNETSLELGPEVLASVNEDGGRLRVEPSVVLAGETVVVAWNDSWGGRTHKTAVGVSVASAFSSDGGRSFQFGGYLPGTSGADSWLSTTGRDEILLQVLSWDSDKQAISIYALTPGPDRAWALRGVAAGGTPGAPVDKPAMATAGDDWVGIAYTAGSEIHVLRSTDRGATWTSPATVSAGDKRLRTGAAIVACGTYVLVAWMEGSGLTLNEVWGAWSADNGRTFSKAARIRRLDSPVKPPPGYALGVGPAAFIANNTWLTCSATEQPVFHLAYGEGRSAGSVVLYQAARTVGGQLRWGAPEVVAGGDSVWAVWPSIAVLGNELAILYYDSRHSENGRPLMDAYLSVGMPGAFADYRLSTVSTSWPDVPGDREYAPVHRNFGDYITVASERRRGVAAWTDGRTGAPRIMVRSFELGAQGHR